MYFDFYQLPSLIKIKVILNNIAIRDGSTAPGRQTSYSKDTQLRNYVHILFEA